MSEVDVSHVQNYILLVKNQNNNAFIGLKQKGESMGISSKLTFF